MICRHYPLRAVLHMQMIYTQHMQFTIHYVIWHFETENPFQRNTKMNHHQSNHLQNVESQQC